MHTVLQQISTQCLHPGPYQPRQDFEVSALRELADSLIAHGLIEPLIVRLLAKDQYEIVAGERRWRAAELAGLTHLPCLVGEYTDKQACAISLVENIQRENLNLIEEATGYRRLLDEFHYHQEEIALLVGKSRSHIANLLRLLNLTDFVQQSVREKKLSLGQARLLVGLSPELQIQLAKDALEKAWTVRQLEVQIKQCKNNNNLIFSKEPAKRDVLRLQTILADQLGAPVQIIEDATKGGWLKLQFFDNDTLSGLLERLGLSYD